MKQVLDKQKVQGAGSLASGASTSKLETLTRDGNVVYLDFAKKQIEQLDKLNKTVSDSLGDKGELSKTLKEIKKSVSEKPGAITEKVMGMGKGTGINATAGGTVKSTFKEKFGSLRGVLDTTGILKKGHNDSFVGGLMDKSLERREQKQQYIKDRVATQGSTFGSKKSFGEAFEKSAKIQGEVQKNQDTIKGLEDRGFKEGQIKRGGFYKKGVELEGQLAKVDTRFSDSFGGPTKDADPKKAKVVKAADDSDKNSTKKRSADVKPIKVESTDSKIKADPDKPKTVKAADVKLIKVESTDSKIKADPDKPKTVKAADVDDPNSTKKRAKVVKKAANEDETLPSNVIKFPGKNKQSSGLGSADLTESDIEQQKVEDAQTKLLQEIADNTQSLKKPVGNKPEPPKDGMGLGIIGTILAGIVGSIVGLARAWVKTIKLFANALIPTELMEKVKKGFTAVDDFFSSIFSKFKSLFDFSGESKIGKIFGTIKEAMSSFIKPFVTAYEVIADLLKGPIKMVSGVFTIIKEYFTMFANTVGKVASIVGKLMVPVLIIMTIWDTVKSAIEGFAEEGIIGGIKGAITGFFNSLIFGPIDMLKDAIAWVLGFFGFDKAKELLESFSLEDIFKKFINAVFAPIDLIKNLFSSIMGWFENLEIPGFEIGIGSFNKKFGPWYPFKKKEKAPESGGDNKSAAVTPKDSAPKKVANQDMSKSNISPEEAKNVLENGSKRDIESLGGAEKLKQIASGAAAKLKPSAEPQTGNQVAAQSANSEMAKNTPTSSSSTVIAPMSSVNNNSSSTYAIKPPVRNPNQGVQNQMQKRYGT